MSKLESDTKFVCIADISHELMPELIRILHEFERKHDDKIEMMKMIAVSKMSPEQFAKMEDDLPGFKFNLDTGMVH